MAGVLFLSGFIEKPLLLYLQLEMFDHGVNGTSVSTYLVFT